MSMLEKLTIRGIRNFGVDAEDEQVMNRLNSLIRSCLRLLFSFFGIFIF